MLQMMEDEESVEQFFLGKEAINSNDDTATYSFVKSTELTLNTALEDKAVDAFANVDAISMTGYKMRSMEVWELVGAKTKHPDDKDQGGTQKQQE
ncbi:LOW QUALITY PROTEIN: hypothetical protein ACHAW6_006705 [Cyclotella cf. meneghiniana]